jgi:SHS2 domain-containing protein
LYDTAVQRGYRQLDHTADLALELWGASEEEVLVAGAEAVIDVMTEGAAAGAATAERSIELDAVDAADRLVQWLNEIIVAAVMDGFLVRSAEIHLDGDSGLRARVQGEAGARVLAELKSATYHDRAQARDDAGGGWRARVVIDV